MLDADSRNGRLLPLKLALAWLVSRSMTMSVFVSQPVGVGFRTLRPCPAHA
jgi:hypothetical protein